MTLDVLCVPISGQKKTPTSGLGHMTRYRVSGWPDIGKNPDIGFGKVPDVGIYHCYYCYHDYHTIIYIIVNTHYYDYYAYWEVLLQLLFSKPIIGIMTIIYYYVKLWFLTHYYNNYGFPNLLYTLLFFQHIISIMTIMVK